MNETIILKSTRDHGIYHSLSEIPESALINYPSGILETLKEGIEYIASIRNQSYEKALADHL